MTTIVYRDGVLAGDTLVTGGGTRHGMIEKVFKTRDGHLCGLCGTLNSHAAFRRWCDGGFNGEFQFLGESGGQEAIVVTKDGEVSILVGANPQRVVVHAPFHAIGSGSYLAIGALGHGATAVEAVQIAVMFDTGSGGQIIQVKTDALLAAEAAAREKQQKEAAEAGDKPKLVQLPEVPRPAGTGNPSGPAGTGNTNGPGPKPGTLPGSKSH